MIDDRVPIRFRRDEGGEIVRILILDEWYDRLKPVYDWVRNVVGVVSIREVPDAADWAADFLRDLVVEYAAAGWAFGFSLFAIFYWAARKAISIVKFTYKYLGYGEGGYGEGPYGGGHVVREFPVES